MTNSMRFTSEQYQAYLARCAASGAKFEQVVCDEPVATTQREDCYSGRIQVCITSYRKRLCDVDNLTPKWFLDSCRYAGLIPDDRPQDIDFTVKQVKSKDERTEIEIIYDDSKAIHSGQI